MRTMKTPLTPEELAQFTGTEQRYRHGINRNALFTDGAKYVADRAAAYWLLDEITLIQPCNKRVCAEAFQVRRLKVNADCTGQLVCEDGNGNIVYTRTIPFTDFPGDGITLWFTDGTILLPSEY
jgi:Family of unknown function (DUF6876)